MRELCHEIQKFSESCALDLHRCVFGIEYDAVLIVIYIRRILEKPVTVVDRHRDNAVVLTRRMIDTSCVTLIFLAQQTFRITALLCQLRCRDRLRILFRLG